MDKVRIDKWLWAARFYKTRSLAKQAVEGGKVRGDGQRLKPSKEITRGMVLTLRVGWDEKTVEVVELSDQRRGAPQAQQLYRETEESIAKRETHAEQRKFMNRVEQRPSGRPTKKQRRELRRLKDHDLF